MGARPGVRVPSPRREEGALAIVARDVGGLQLLVAGGMLVCALVGLLAGEPYSALGLAAGAAVTGAVGGLAFRRFRAAGEPHRRHAMLVAGAGWLVSAAFGALPFLLTALWTPETEVRALLPPGGGYESSLVHFRNPLHALFESMSAYTTTGLTMAVHEPSIGYGLLFYRSWAQWIGGAGVVVLSLAVLPRPRAAGNLELYQSETSGAKLRPSIIGTARAIWKIYAGLTLLVAAYLFGATMLVLPRWGVGRSLFDAVNHAMTAQSTGGFSTLDDSIAGFGSYAMEVVHLLPMILGAVSLPLYYSFLHSRRVAVFWRDPQFRSMILLFVVLVPLLACVLAGSPVVSDPFREGLFQVVSAVSTTGWQTADVSRWPSSAVLVLTWGAMLVGGAAGATVGGIKLVRAYLLTRAAGWRIRKVFLPEAAVVPVRLGERALGAEEMQREVSTAAVFSFLYLVILFAATVLTAHLMPAHFTLADAIFEAASAQGTVGLSSGITDPGMPAAIEIVFILQMWVGRLEILPVIVLGGALWKWIRRR